MVLYYIYIISYHIILYYIISYHIIYIYTHILHITYTYNPLFPHRILLDFSKKDGKTAPVLKTRSKAGWNPQCAGITLATSAMRLPTGSSLPRLHPSMDWFKGKFSGKGFSCKFFPKPIHCIPNLGTGKDQKPPRYPELNGEGPFNHHAWWNNTGEITGDFLL